MPSKRKQIVVRPNDLIYEKATELANLKGMSLSQLIIDLLADELIRMRILVPGEKKVDRAEKTQQISESHSKLMTARDLLSSGIIGMWEDRTDIGDSSEYARKLREQAEKRVKD